MLREDFILAILGSMADIREALWSLVAAVGMLATTVLAHAVALRRDRDREKK